MHDVEFAEDALAAQHVYEMMCGENAAPSVTEAQQMARAIASSAATLFDVCQYIKRTEILIRAALTPNHSLANALSLEFECLHPEVHLY